MSSSIYAPGSIVPWHFVPGLVIASFFASLIGTTLTVELLHRKRLGSNLMSRIQLALCAVSMGLIGIWCMHFIGNRSIVLGNGDTSIQISYSPGYTFLSCVLPVIGLTFSFYLAEVHVKSIVLRTAFDLCSGILAGLSIVGMHYIGNLGASNYTLTYPARFIIASCVIAIGDCIIALMLFFYFKERWISVLWKRMFCAVILAVAVCGMHYTASVGCTYRLKHEAHTTASERNTAVIVAGILCCVAAFSVLGVIFYTNQRHEKLAAKAQQVMIACAYFDEEGNVMVTNEGLLPSQKIAKRFDLQRFDDEFNTGHPLFHWIWKVSHDWEAVASLIVKMRLNIYRRGSSDVKSASTDPAVTLDDEESYVDTTILFREAFCVAASDLSTRLQGSLEQLGTLFDQVVGTGDLPTNRNSRATTLETNDQSDALSERGQLLFFTRELSRADVDAFTNAGYRFASPNRVEHINAKTMRIAPKNLNTHMKRLQEYASKFSHPIPAKQGTYLSCFSVLGHVRGKFDVIVNKMNQDQLPDARLHAEQLSQSQIDFLRQYDGLTAAKISDDIMAKDSKRRQGDGSTSQGENVLVGMLIEAFAVLTQNLGTEGFSELIFNATPICARYGTSEPVMVFGFTRVIDHAGTNIPESLTYVPLEFFLLRAQYYPGSTDHGRLRRAIHTEFAPLLAESSPGGEELDSNTAATRKYPRRKPSSKSVSSDAEMLKSDSSSDQGFVSVDGIDDSYELESHKPPTSKHLWGGILATTDTIVATTTKVEYVGDNGFIVESFAPQASTTAVIAGRTDGEGEDDTFADLLFSQAKQRIVRGASTPADF